jgi:hypothetical protein
MFQKKILIICLLFVGLNLNALCQNQFVKIDIEKAVKNHQSPNLTDIVESITYIPLETNSESLLGRDIQKVIIKDDRILIYDYAHCYVFDTNGKYITQFIKIGRGPFEVIQILDICYSKKNDLLFAVDPRDKKVVVYDNMYNPKYEFTTPFWSIKICAFNENIAYVNMQCDIDGSQILFNVANRDGKIIKSFKHNRNPKLKIGINYLPIILYPYQGKLMYKDKWCDTVYCVNSNLEISPHMILKLGDYKSSPEFNDISGIDGKNRKSNNLLDIWDIIELKNYVIIKLNKGFIYYLKNSGKTYYHEPEISKHQQWIGLTNDIDDGPAFLPKFGINDDSILSIVYAYDLQLNNENFKIKNKWASKIQLDDNPILMIAKLKK